MQVGKFIHLVSAGRIEAVFGESWGERQILVILQGDTPSQKCNVLSVPRLKLHYGYQIP